VAKPNYSFEKRQREMAKKKKKEEKAYRKASPATGQPEDQQADDAGAPAVAEPPAGSPGPV
jgi:hypothetical protein